jgi:hypothetical protein
MLFPSKGESWVMTWGTRLGKQGGGNGLVMIVLLFFSSLEALFFWEKEMAQGKKSKVGPKKKMAS